MYIYTRSAGVRRHETYFPWGPMCRICSCPKKACKSLQTARPLWQDRLSSSYSNLQRAFDCLPIANWTGQRYICCGWPCYWFRSATVGSKNQICHDALLWFAGPKPVQWGSSSEAKASLKTAVLLIFLCFACIWATNDVSGWSLFAFVCDHKLHYERPMPKADYHIPDQTLQLI